MVTPARKQATKASGLIAIRERERTAIPVRSHNLIRKPGSAPGQVSGDQLPAPTLEELLKRGADNFGPAFDEILPRESRRPREGIQTFVSQF